MPEPPRSKRFQIHLSTAIVLFFASLSPAAEATQDYPFWDGHESVEAYAKRVDLSSTMQLDFRNGVTLDLVLIPTGRFVMGTSEPRKPEVSISSAQVLIAVAASLAFALLATLIKFRWRGWRVSFSLRWLLAFCLACSVMVWGGTRLHQAMKESARYAAEMAVYDKLPAHEKPGHIETITQPFYMSKYSVTQAQYEAVTGNNPSFFKGPELPVEMVSWHTASEFCSSLNAKLKGTLHKGVTVQLPSEAQWEYAARAGTTTSFNTGEALSLDEANFDGTHSSPFLRWQGISRRKITPVGSYKPNAFGLYEMHGNVSQWCVDDCGKDPDSGRLLGAVRGGHYRASPTRCRSAYRDLFPKHVLTDLVGFRITLTVPPLTRE